MLFLVFLVELNKCKKIGAVTKKSTGLTTTLTSDCEGVDCHKIEDAFFELQFEMKALILKR